MGDTGEPHQLGKIKFKMFIISDRKLSVSAEISVSVCLSVSVSSTWKKIKFKMFIITEWKPLNVITDNVIAQFM